MSAPRRLRHRLWARLVAWVGGYFWLPCPRCGQMFAGYEIGDESVTIDGHDWSCCVGCSPRRPVSDVVWRSPDAPWPFRPVRRLR